SVREPPKPLGCCLGFPRRALLQLMSHRLCGPREPPFSHSPTPQADGIDRLGGALPLLAVQRPPHPHRPRQRVVLRFIAPDTTIHVALDHDPGVFHTQALQPPLMAGPLNRGCPCRELLLNRSVLHRATAAGTPPCRFYL